MLSWKQAWLKLATAFEGPYRDDYGFLGVEVVPGATISCGLCDAAADLVQAERITHDTYQLMIDAASPGHRGFRWSVSPPGHKARVRFCRKMAETPRPRKGA